MSLQIILPTGSTERLDCSILLYVNSLRISIEKRIGIPYELQKVCYNGKVLDDNKSLVDQGVPVGATLKVDVDLWWNKIICLSLQGNIATLGRRVSIPMQQIGESNRIFATLYICAARGYPKGVDNLLSMFKDFDMETVTKVTGRTLVHAAVGSGSLKCVEEIKKHTGMKFEKLLYMKDKAGQTALDELTVTDTRMLNYINKFLSSPINIEQLKNNKDNKETSKENTFTIEPTIKEIIRDNGVNREKSDVRTIKENDLPKLDRSKDEQNVKIVSPIQNENRNQTPTISVAPLIIEKTENSKSLRVGETLPQMKDKFGHLPLIPQRESSSNQIYSPRPMRKTSQSSYVPHIAKQPRPPSQDKKRPVAGKLMESNLRKFSAATRPKIVVADHAFNHNNMNRNVAQPFNDNGKQLNTHHHSNNHQQRPKSPSPSRGGEEKKVRRISLIRSPRPLSPSPFGGSPTIMENEDTSEPIVIEIEQERIEKPWNNWINKAVTVEAETPPESLHPTTPDTNATSTAATLQVQDGGTEKVRKKSFDRWVQEKAQEEQEKELQKMREAYDKELKDAEIKAAHHGKSFEEWVLEKEQNARLQKEQKEREDSERREAELKAKQQGKSFDQWVREKEEYDKLFKQQQDHDEKENLKPQKFLKGKTFEEWQKETEAKEKHEIEEKKMKETKEKEKQDDAKQRRRKESTAKYQQWLLDKEQLEFEKEMQELKKRKVSTVKTRRISTMKKN